MTFTTERKSIQLTPTSADDDGLNFKIPTLPPDTYYTNNSYIEASLSNGIYMAFSLYLNDWMKDEDGKILNFHKDKNGELYTRIYILDSYEKQKQLIEQALDW